MSKEMREQINKVKNWKPILNEEAPDLKQASEIARELKEKNCQWDISQPGIKVFFDVTSFNHELQTFFGKAIIVGNIISNALKGKFKNSTASANHVGFIFSDGSIFHATNDNIGVQFVSNFQDISKNPETYFVMNLGGSESTVRAVCQDMFKKIEQSKSESMKSQSTYDMKGIVRQIPIIGKIIAKFKFGKETSNYSFFCSELVANVLVRAKRISYEELKIKNLRPESYIGDKPINEELTGLDISDEISPTELYEMLAPIASNVPVICKN